MVNCKCVDWATEDTTSLLLGNGHNPRCDRFIANAHALELISNLAESLKWWGDQEDGIPSEIWPYYEEAVFLTTGKIPKDYHND